MWRVSVPKRQTHCCGRTQFLSDQDLTIRGATGFTRGRGTTTIFVTVVSQGCCRKTVCWSLAVCWPSSFWKLFFPERHKKADMLGGKIKSALEVSHLFRNFIWTLNELAFRWEQHLLTPRACLEGKLAWHTYTLPTEAPTNTIKRRNLWGMVSKLRTRNWISNDQVVWQIVPQADVFALQSDVSFFLKRRAERLSGK